MTITGITELVNPDIKSIFKSSIPPFSSFLTGSSSSKPRGAKMTKVLSYIDIIAHKQTDLNTVCFLKNDFQLLVNPCNVEELV